MQTNEKRRSGLSTRMIAEAGVMIALAKVLSFIKLFEMPMGGSVTLASMAPILIFALRWGWKRGVIVGAVYGVLDFILGGYIVHPLQALLDYPIAYAMLGFAGLAQIKDSEGWDGLLHFIPASVLAVLLRLAMHVLSGCIFYSSIDFEAGGTLGQALTWSNLSGGFAYSLGYNGSFLGADFLICLVILALLWKPLGRMLQRQRG